ncbi:MAG TPA: hypothetical protein VGM46_01425 [Mesorhizobium sp.]
MKKSFVSALGLAIALAFSAPMLGAGSASAASMHTPSSHRKVHHHHTVVHHHKHHVSHKMHHASGHMTHHRAHKKHAVHHSAHKMHVAKKY